MFSECASSQIGSVDSYSELKEEEAEKVEKLVADLDNSDISLSELHNEIQNSKAGSKASILDALDFSSDDDEDSLTGKKKTGTKASGKSASNLPLVSCESATRKTDSQEKRSRKQFHNVAMSRFYFSSPGPAAYYPKINPVRQSAPAYLLKFRHHLKDGGLGPGPAAYLVTKPCCTMKYVEAHYAERFNPICSDNPGPAAYNTGKYYATGKDKPKARIISRWKVKPPKGNVGPLPDTYGITRFGPAHPPSAVLIGKPYDNLRIGPGPGAYDPEKCKDCRIGIQIRGKPSHNFGVDLSIPGPQYLLPSTLTGPAWSLVGKKSSVVKSDSPGPIYKPLQDNRKPLSITFRPFPVRAPVEYPGPLHYEGVGDQWIRTKHTSPRALIASRMDPHYGRLKIPGPNKYFPPSKIGFTEYNIPCLKGRWKSKKKFGPGPADYNVPSLPPSIPKAPAAVIPHKDKGKKVKDSGPGFKYDVKLDRGTVRNIILSSRWRIPSKGDGKPDPPFYDLTGFTQRGKSTRIGPTFKSRQSPFVYQGLSSTAKVDTSLDVCNLRSLHYEKATQLVQ